MPNQKLHGQPLLVYPNQIPTHQHQRRPPLPNPGTSKTSQVNNRPVQLSDLHFIVQEMSQTVTKTVTEHVLQVVREPPVFGKARRKAPVSTKVRKIIEKEKDSVRNKFKVSLSLCVVHL